MTAATAEQAQERKPDRLDRGLQLWREHRDEIRELSGGLWSVPSGSGPGAYLVDLEAGICECADRKFSCAATEMCKHLWAAVFEMYSNGKG